MLLGVLLIVVVAPNIYVVLKPSTFVDISTIFNASPRPVIPTDTHGPAQEPPKYRPEYEFRPSLMAH